MKSYLIPIAALGVALIPTTAVSLAADLTLRVVYEGPAPAAHPVNVDRDVSFCGKHRLRDESLLIDPENGGIANVAVYLDAGRRAGMVQLDDLNLPDPPKRKIEFAARNCRFEPRLVVLRSGDTLVFRNQDEIGHNVNVAFLRNSPMGLLIPPNDPMIIHPQLRSEPAPLPVNCNIHPWMKAWLMVLDHPYVGISDENGVLKMRGLPENRELTFRIWHEQIRFQQAKIVVTATGDPTEREQDWKRNRFKRTLSAGANDLGTITVTRQHLPVEVQQRLSEPVDSRLD